MPCRAVDAKLACMNTHEQNKAAVRDCFSQAAAGNFEALPGLLAEGYVLHPEGVRGAAGLAEMVRGYRSQIPDLSITVDQQFTEGDHVATRFTVRGRHVTDHDVEFTGLTISRCRDGKIEEEWELVDVMSLLAQIGQLPEPSTV
jgi:predicted ester cyclase